MNDTLKNPRQHDKVATVPIPGPMWDAATPVQQLAILQIESAKFMAATHGTSFGGFRIVVMRDDESEIVLIVGREIGPIVSPTSPLTGFN
jgi:hypothetical protein